MHLSFFAFKNATPAGDRMSRKKVCAAGEAIFSTQAAAPAGVYLYFGNHVGEVASNKQILMYLGASVILMGPHYYSDVGLASLGGVKSAGVIQTQQILCVYIRYILRRAFTGWGHDYPNVGLVSCFTHAYLSLALHCILIGLVTLFDEYCGVSTIPNGIKYVYGNYSPAVYAITRMRCTNEGKISAFRDEHPARASCAGRPEECEAVYSNVGGSRPWSMASGLYHSCPILHFDFIEGCVKATNYQSSPCTAVQNLCYVSTTSTESDYAMCLYAQGKWQVIEMQGPLSLATDCYDAEFSGSRSGEMRRLCG